MALRTLLEHVADTGHAEVQWSTLTRWYDKQRITQSVWRDVSEKWGECRLNDKDKLLVQPLASSYLFVCDYNNSAFTIKEIDGLYD
jgi:hypothetical protein